MSILGLIILLAIAAITGMIGQALVGYSLGGCFLSAVVGFIGAFFGMLIARQVGLPEPLPVTVEDETFPVMWAIIGSALLTAVIALISRRRRLI